MRVRAPLLLFLIPLAFQPRPATAQAKVGFLRLDGCQGPGGAVIDSVVAPDLAWVARADTDPKRPQPVILVNPEATVASYLSPDTVEWFYLRECAHLQRHHLAVSALTPAEHADADCRALQLLRQRRGDGFTGREFVVIKRDLELLRADDWVEWLGPRRPLDLSRCEK